MHATSAVFSKHGDRILTSSLDNTAKLWNAETGQLILSLESHNQPVFSAVFSKDGDRILTASCDNTAKLWNAETGECIRSLRGHNGAVWSATFSDAIIKIEGNFARAQGATD